MAQTGEYTSVHGDGFDEPTGDQEAPRSCCERWIQHVKDSIPASPQKEKTQWQIEFDNMVFLHKIKFMVRHRLGLDWAAGWLTVMSIYWPVIPYLIESMMVRGMLGLFLSCIGGFICFWKGGRSPAIKKLEQMQTDEFRAQQVQAYHDQIQTIRERALEVLQKQKSYREDTIQHVQALSETLNRSLLSLASQQPAQAAAATVAATAMQKDDFLQGKAVTDSQTNLNPAFVVTELQAQSTTLVAAPLATTVAPLAPSGAAVTTTAAAAVTDTTNVGIDTKTNAAPTLDLSQASLGHSSLFMDDSKEPEHAITVAKSILDLQKLRPVLASLLLQGSTLADEEAEIFKLLEAHTPDASLDIR